MVELSDSDIEAGVEEGWLESYDKEVEWELIRKRLPKYSIIFHEFTIEFDLEKIEPQLLGLILTFHKANKPCWLSNQSMGILTSSTEPTVIKHLKRLEKLWLIERGGKHSVYKTQIWRLGPVGEEWFHKIQKNLRAGKKKFKSEPKDS